VSTYTPRHVLITGGAGFIGSHVVDHLLRRDACMQIVTLDLLTYAGSRQNLGDALGHERHTFVPGDICDRAVVDRLLREYAIDTIVHCAAESHVDRSIVGPAAFIQTNVVGTFTLLEAARVYWLEERQLDHQSCRFHHISTDEVYGTLGPHDPPWTETTPYAPNSPYAASKAAADHLVRAYAQTYHLPTTTTNCSNNYGPRQHPEKFIPTIIRSCLQGHPIPVYGDGSNIRDWLYVEDHCRGIETVMRHGQIGATYNIGGANGRPNLEVVHRICTCVAELTAMPAEYFTRLIRFVNDRPGHDWRYAVDATKITRELGWHPAESFETGLRKTTQWYVKHYREAA
jgi:dTDP-glucose 4,6-dehydratase